MLSRSVIWEKRKDGCNITQIPRNIVNIPDPKIIVDAPKNSSSIPLK